MGREVHHEINGQRNRQVIASMVADPNTSVEDAIMLNNLEECIIDPSTMEKGWRDEDGDEHWTEDLVLVDD